MSPEEQNQINSEIFEKINKLVTDVALLSQAVKTQGEAFKIHDEKEMDKFAKVEEAIYGFRKMLWIGLGVVLASSDSIWSVVIKIVG